MDDFVVPLEVHFRPKEDVVADRVIDDPRLLADVGDAAVDSDR